MRIFRGSSAFTLHLGDAVFTAPFAGRRSGEIDRTTTLNRDLTVVTVTCSTCGLQPSLEISLLQTYFTSYTVMERWGVVFVRLVKVGTSTRAVQLSTVDVSAMGETFLLKNTKITAEITGDGCILGGYQIH